MWNTIVDLGTLIKGLFQLFVEMVSLVIKLNGIQTEFLATILGVPVVLLSIVSFLFKQIQKRV